MTVEIVSRPPLPDHWRWAKLGEVCELYQPQTIGLKDLVSNGRYPVFGANGLLGRYDRYNHEDPEVLIGCRGSCGSINVSEPYSWITGNAMVVHPEDDQLTKEFLLALLRVSDLSSTISGTAQPQITRKSLAPFLIPLPPLDEQRRIVARLDERMAVAERARVAADRIAEAANALKNSLLREILP